MGECALIVCKPVEDSLPNDGHDDLDRVGGANLGAKGRFGVFDCADDQNVSQDKPYLGIGIGKRLNTRS